MRPISGAALLLVVTALVYAPSLGYGFLYEDNNDLPLLLAPMTPILSANNPARVLTQVSYALSAEISHEPWSYHAVSIALHLLNAALVGLLAWQVLPPWGAVGALAVFALHPVQVEAVAYVSGRADLVSTTGLLLALLATSAGWFTGALLGLALACLGKESAVMAWAVVPLWAAVTGARFPFRTYAVLSAGALVGGAVGLAASVHVFSPSVDLVLVGHTAWSVVRLALLLVLPIGQTIDHDWLNVPAWGLALSAGLLASLALASVMKMRAEASWFSFAVVVTLVWFLPRFLVPSVEGLHEHHMMAIMPFWSLCAGGWLAGLSRPRRSLSHAA